MTTDNEDYDDISWEYNMKYVVELKIPIDYYNDFLPICIKHRTRFEYTTTDYTAKESVNSIYLINGSIIQPLQKKHPIGKKMWNGFGMNEDYDILQRNEQNNNEYLFCDILYYEQFLRKTEEYFHFVQFYNLNMHHYTQFNNFNGVSQEFFINTAKLIIPETTENNFSTQSSQSSQFFVMCERNTKYEDYLLQKIRDEIIENDEQRYKLNYFQNCARFLYLLKENNFNVAKKNFDDLTNYLHQELKKTKTFICKNNEDFINNIVANDIGHSNIKYQGFVFEMK